VDKEYIKQRIVAFAGMEVDPSNDAQVQDMLKRKFNILLPQRTSFEASLSSAISDNEIISLLIQYRESVKVKEVRHPNALNDRNY
jgi:hypothetical protein